MFQVAKNPINAISLGGVYGAILGTGNDRPEPETIFNTDVTSLEIGKGDAPAIFTSIGARKELKDHRRGSTVVKKTPKYRTIKLMTTTSAAGALLCTVAIIKDTNIKSLEKWKVRMPNHGKYFCNTTQLNEQRKIWLPLVPDIGFKVGQQLMEEAIREVILP